MIKLSMRLPFHIYFPYVYTTIEQKSNKRLASVQLPSAVQSVHTWRLDYTWTTPAHCQAHTALTVSGPIIRC